MRISAVPEPDDSKRIDRRSRNIASLICLLEFKGRRRTPMTPNRYTELFFPDKAVAFAAGHRPSGECRAQDHRAYIDAVNAGSDDPIEGAKGLDRRLNASRRESQRPTEIRTLPDGVFIVLGDGSFRDYWLIWHGALYRWSPGGYADAVALGDVADESTVPIPGAVGAHSAARLPGTGSSFGRQARTASPIAWVVEYLRRHPWADVTGGG